jgi:hypothetical protein
MQGSFPSLERIGIGAFEGYFDDGVWGEEDTILKRGSSISLNDAKSLKTIGDNAFEGFYGKLNVSVSLPPLSKSEFSLKTPHIGFHRFPYCLMASAT